MKEDVKKLYSGGVKMGDSTKRFGWVDDGLDQKSRIQGNDLKERAGKENKHTLNLRERVQDDEHTRINNYSEGYCYGCSKTDKVISTLIYMCGEDMEKRGTEGLMCLVTKKTSYELCDICATWQQNDVWQINCSMCDRCMKRLNKVHKAYRAKGGRANAPNEIAKRQYYARNPGELMGDGITRDQTNNQSFSRR